jgi:cytochrome c-type biogenesis protein CcmH/NrfG
VRDATRPGGTFSAAHPGHADGSCLLGVVNLALGKRDEAVGSHRRAVALDPAQAEAHDTLGVALKHQRRFDEARDCFERADALDPDHAEAHLAGALGVPTWVALPWLADWRWLLTRDDSPWYPTARLFRQSVPGAWGDVFARMAERLRSM